MKNNFSFTFTFTIDTISASKTALKTFLFRWLFV